MYLTLLIEGQS